MGEFLRSPEIRCYQRWHSHFLCVISLSKCDFKTPSPGNCVIINLIYYDNSPSILTGRELPTFRMEQGGIISLVCFWAGLPKRSSDLWETGNGASGDGAATGFTACQAVGRCFQGRPLKALPRIGLRPAPRPGPAHPAAHGAWRREDAAPHGHR